jgi:hypothetical protein
LVSKALIQIEADCRTQGVGFVCEREILTAAGDAESRRLQWRVTVKAGPGKEQIGIIPDGAFAIEQPERRRYFFLEIDRGTMPVCRKSLRLSSIRRKLLAYAATRAGRVLRDRFGISGFQVLFIAESIERMERMREMCASITGKGKAPLFLFASRDARTPFPILPHMSVN